VRGKAVYEGTATEIYDNPLLMATSLLSIVECNKNTFINVADANKSHNFHIKKYLSYHYILLWD